MADKAPSEGTAVQLVSKLTDFGIDGKASPLKPSVDVAGVTLPIRDLRTTTTEFAPSSAGMLRPRPQRALRPDWAVS